MLLSTINTSDSVKEYLSSGCQQHRIDNRSLSLTASRRGHNHLPGDRGAGPGSSFSSRRDQENANSSHRQRRQPTVFQRIYRFYTCFVLVN